MPEALPELAWFALLLFAFGLVYAVRGLLKGVFAIIGATINAAHIPYLAAYLERQLAAMEQAVDNALGSALSGIDSLMGASWHRFAELNEWLWREFKKHSLLGWMTAQQVYAQALAYHALRNAVRDLRGLHSWAYTHLKTLEQDYKGIEHKVKNLAREVGNGIGDDVLPRLRTLEHDVATVTGTAIPAIQQAESDAASAISNLYEWAKGKASLLGVGTFAFAVSVALDALGLGGLKCPSFLSSLRNRGCGLWNGLEDVLGLLVDVAIIGSLCDVLPWLTTGVDNIGLGLVETIHAAGITACSGTYPPAPPMPSVTLIAPTVYGTTLTTAGG